jgi:hypothetical protein
VLLVGSPAQAQTQDDLFDDTRLQDIQMIVSECDWNELRAPHRRGHLLSGESAMEWHHGAQRVAADPVPPFSFEEFRGRVLRDKSRCRLGTGALR